MKCQKCKFYKLENQHLKWQLAEYCKMAVKDNAEIAKLTGKIENERKHKRIL